MSIEVLESFENDGGQRVVDFLINKEKEVYLTIGGETAFLPAMTFAIRAVMSSGKSCRHRVSRTGSRRISRSGWRIGLVTAASFLLPIAIVALITLVFSGITYDNLTILPLLLDELLMWVAFPAWLIAIVALLWPDRPAGMGTSAVKSAG